MMSSKGTMMKGSSGTVPTEVISKEYPMTDYLGQYVDDSLEYSDALMNSRVRGARKQNYTGKY